MGQRMVTIFKRLHHTSTGFNRDVYVALERIRNGASKETVDLLRSIDKNKKEERNKVKSTLPGVCFNGTFRNRSISGLVEHSGLMVIDLDDFVSTEKVIEAKNNLSKDPYIFSCWISPSGLGVKALVCVPKDAKNHKGYFSSFKSHLNAKNWDDSGSDVSRFCFESYDPDIYINNDSSTWIEVELPELEDIGTREAVIPVVSENKIITNLVAWWEKKYGATVGSRNTNLFKLAVAFNDFGVQESVCRDYFLKYISKDFPEKEVVSIQKSAYKKVENFGSKQFEDNDTKEKIEKLVRAGKSKKDISSTFSYIKEEDVNRYTDNVKENISIDEFWTYSDKGKISLSPHRYKFWIEQHNFSKFYPSAESNTFTFITKHQNLIEETNEKRIKDFVLNRIMGDANVGYGPFDFMASNTSYFKQEFLSMLDTADIAIKEDKREACYLYYRNCVVEVTSGGVREIDYIDIDGYVWRKRVIERDFKVFDHHEAEFRKFIWLIAGQDVSKYNTFKSVIGYLLHSFKTSANNKAVIFNDKTISENPNGGSGKGIFWNAFKNMKKVSIIDGKTWDPSRSFPYQTVSSDTQILVFDDVKRNFSFESLFSVITEGITLEYKGQDAINIPVEKSPKILITTNYTVGGVGGSFDRRKFEVEMSDYFSSTHTPLDVFGHMLFSDWNKEEWLRFDNYMINCEQYYLKNGLVKHDFDNLDVRKFIKETSHEFYEWTEEGNLPLNERITRSAYFDTFISEYPDLKKWLSQRKFSKWMEVYAVFKGYRYTTGKSQGNRWSEYGTDTGEKKECPF